MDLLPDKICENARGLNDLSVFGNDLLRQSFLHIFDLMKILFHSVPGYVQFAGYFFVGLMEFVQVYDSTYICHRFHLTAHLSEYLEREGFPSWGGQKRIGVSLNRGVKIESAKTIMSKRIGGNISSSIRRPLQTCLGLHQRETSSYILKCMQALLCAMF